MIRILATSRLAENLAKFLDFSAKLAFYIKNWQFKSESM